MQKNSLIVKSYSRAVSENKLALFLRQPFMIL